MSSIIAIGFLLLSRIGKELKGERAWGVDAARYRVVAKFYILNDKVMHSEILRLRLPGTLVWLNDT
jgi:hypothetical protein